MLGILCLFWTNRSLLTAVTHFKVVFSSIWANKGHIAVITVWTSHSCVSGWIYGTLWKLHTWCLSHRVKNITTSQEVPFILNWITFTGFRQWQIALHHSTDWAYRETTAPINLTSKNVQKYPSTHPPNTTNTHTPPLYSKVHTYKITQKPTRFRISNQSNPIKLTKLGKFFE